MIHTRKATLSLGEEITELISIDLVQKTVKEMIAEHASKANEHTRNTHWQLLSGDSGGARRNAIDAEGHVQSIEALHELLVRLEIAQPKQEKHPDEPEE